MSVFTRLIPPAPSARRAYSFFSHSGGSGGGRFFNSARPAPTIQAATGPGNSSGGRSGPPKSAGAGSQSGANGAKSAPASTADAAKLAPEQQEASAPAASPAAELATAPQLSFNPAWVEPHPAPSAQDLRLHQFFSLHRPLLGLGQPGASVFEATQGTIPFATSPPAAEPASEAAEVEESSIEADSHTARQLSHALVMNRVGSAVAFDNALHQLGLETSTDLTVQLDSTKRKRRSKMKKHKLRKRRKLQRSTRLKLK